MATINVAIYNKHMRSLLSVVAVSLLVLSGVIIAITLISDLNLYVKAVSIGFASALAIGSLIGLLKPKIVKFILYYLPLP